MEKTSVPGPQSYDLVSGLSMCSSTQKFSQSRNPPHGKIDASLSPHEFKIPGMKLIKPLGTDEAAFNSFDNSAEKRAHIYLPSRNSHAVYTEFALQTFTDLRDSIENPNKLSQTTLKKFLMKSRNNGNGQRLTLAPKIKGGTIAQRVRKTDFPVASELRI